jgi:hypothetical protein
MEEDLLLKMRQQDFRKGHQLPLKPGLLYFHEAGSWSWLRCAILCNYAACFSSVWLPFRKLPLTTGGVWACNQSSLSFSSLALMRPASLYPLKTAQIGRACTALTVLLGRIHIRPLSKVAAISREHAYALARSPVHVHCQSLGQLSSLDSQRRPINL